MPLRSEAIGLTPVRKLPAKAFVGSNGWAVVFGTSSRSRTPAGLDLRVQAD